MQSPHYIFISVIFVWTNIHAFTDENACLELCVCDHRFAYCDQVNLTYIPKLPMSIDSIYFINGNLSIISKQTFEHIAHLRLQLLVLHNNSITNIETHSLRTFTSLAKLDLSYNNLELSSLYNLTADLKYIGGLSTLTLKNIGLNQLPINLFHGMERSYLRYLDLSNNNIKTVNFKVFRPLSRLLKLKIRNCRVTQIIFNHLSLLTGLYLTSNKLRDIPSVCSNNSPMFPNLVELNLSNNTISGYIPKDMNCLKMLKKLNLENNCIVNVGTNFFSHLKSLEVLLLSRQFSPVKKMEIKQYAFNNTKLKTLQLHGNNMVVKHLDDLAFAGCPNLEMLEISTNHLSDYNSKTSVKLNKLLSHVTTIHTLGMTYGLLYDIPSVIRQMPHLKTLDMRQNEIETWPKGFFDNNPNLTFLNVQKNTIKRVTTDMFDENLIKKLRTIEIGQNPMNCDCDLVWFIQWVNGEKSHLFKDYPLGYACLNITQRLCLKESPLYSSVTAVSSIIICIFLLISVVYKYRWVIKYQIYIWRHQSVKQREIDDISYLYDVFVSYSCGDSDWVLDQLLPQLEDGTLKLCIHERDFEGGKMIIDNIVESIENSRRVVIVLSNEFAKSDWCQFEVNIAQKRVLNEYMPPLTVILLEDINVENMSTCINVLLKNTTYISWSEDERYTSLFWTRVKESLKNKE